MRTNCPPTRFDKAFNSLCMPTKMWNWKLKWWKLLRHRGVDWADFYSMNNPTHCTNVSIFSKLSCFGTHESIFDINQAD